MSFGMMSLGLVYKQQSINETQDSLLTFILQQGPLLSTCVRLLLEFSTCTDQLSFLVMLLLIRIMPDLIASPVYLLPCFD